MYTDGRTIGCTFVFAEAALEALADQNIPFIF